MEDWQVYPRQTVEVTTGEAAQLLGFDGIDGLEGWKIFKKIGRAFKKVGKAIKKIKLKSVFKVALPIAGAFFAPLALAKLGSVAAKFGPKVARLVGGGKTKAIIIRSVRGAKQVGLVSDAEYARFRSVLKSPSQAISAALFQQIVGAPASDRVAEGANVVGTEVQMPVQEQPTVATVSEIPSKVTAASATGGIPAVALIGGAAILALALSGRRR